MKKTLPAAYLEPVGQRLQELVKMLEMKDRELAKRLGISPQAWGNYCSGTRPLPVDVAHEIARLSHVTLDWIYLGDGRGVPYSVLERLPGHSPPIPVLRTATSQEVRRSAARSRNR